MEGNKKEIKSKNLAKAHSSVMLDHAHGTKQVHTLDTYMTLDVIIIR